MDPTAPQPAEYLNRDGRDRLGNSSETQVERLVADIGHVIQNAEPGKRAELKELAEALLHEEVSSIPEATHSAHSAVKPSRLNPLTPGLLLLLLGLGLFMIVPLIGISLGVIGLALAVWGGVLSLIKK